MLHYPILSPFIYSWNYNIFIRSLSSIFCEKELSYVNKFIKRLIKKEILIFNWYKRTMEELSTIEFFFQKWSLRLLERSSRIGFIGRY